MLTYVIGDLFTSPASVLVNTVNTVGVMGKGLAKQFKAYLPDMFEKYQRLCESGELQPGRLFYYRGINKSILNFPTKRDWRQPSRLEDIEAGLKTFVDQYEAFSIDSVAFPQLGCGNGELDWDHQVRPLMEQYLGSLPIPVYVHLYDSESRFVEHRSVQEMKTWLSSEPESLPFAEMWRDVATVVDRIPASKLDDWTIEVDDPTHDAPLTLKKPGLTIRVSADELRDVWMTLKSFGLLTEEDLPSAIQPASGVFAALLSNLDYVEQSRFLFVTSRGVSLEPESFAVGLKLVPRAASPVDARQLEFAGLA